MRLRQVTGPTDDVVIVGAGLGGLSAALRLLGAGRNVTVIEQQELPGGRAGLLERDGFRFDTGPTVLTMPELIDDALACVGERLAEMQLRILWEEILPRFPAIEVLGPPQRLYSNFIHGIRSLPVRIPD